MALKCSYSENVNTVLPYKVFPNRVVFYFFKHDLSVEISGINLFHILYYRHCTIGLVTSTQHRALLFLLPFLVGNIRLNWMFCLASSLSQTTKYDLHSHFTDETTAHEENRHRQWRFWRFLQTGESSRWLCSTYSKSPFAPSQPSLFVSITRVHRDCAGYDEPALVIQVHRWITLHTQKYFSACEQLSARSVCLNCKRASLAKIEETH